MEKQGGIYKIINPESQFWIVIGRDKESLFRKMKDGQYGDLKLLSSIIRFGVPQHRIEPLEENIPSKDLPKRKREWKIALFSSKKKADIIKYGSVNAKTEEEKEYWEGMKDEKKRGYDIKERTYWTLVNGVWTKVTGKNKVVIEPEHGTIQDTIERLEEFDEYNQRLEIEEPIEEDPEEDD